MLVLLLRTQPMALPLLKLEAVPLPKVVLQLHRREVREVLLLKMEAPPLLRKEVPLVNKLGMPQLAKEEANSEELAASSSHRLAFDELETGLRGYLRAAALIIPWTRM